VTGGAYERVTDITYRDATPADIPAIDALFRRSFADTFGHLYAPADLAAFFGQFTPEAWAEEFTQLRFRVAERKGRLVGYAKLGAVALPVTPLGQAAELWQLYLADEAKGAGVADELLRWAIDTARRDGAGELFLSVYVDNHRAKRFYARHGFVDIGPYAFPVGDHLDEDRLMRLVL
jgi:ribosomal protein S18 acetylase RimI-like enzyme